MEPDHLNAGNAGPFTLDGTRTFLVGSRDVALIDPGPDSDAHLRALLDAVEPARSVAVLVTHWHPDHAGLASALAERLGVPIRGPGPPSTDPVLDGQALETDHGPLIAVDTPGHARPHVVYHWPAAGAVFLGDLMLGEGDTTWVGEYPGCVADYLRSLDTVRSLGATVGYPAHGPPIRDLPAALDRYERHRQARIDQVARARAARPDADAEALLGDIYPGLPAGVAQAALASIRVILHHLDGVRDGLP